MNIYIDYKNNSLKELTDTIINLFKSNNYQVQNNINANTNFILVNELNNTNTNEVIYPLQNTDILAKEISSNINASKYYQKRSSINTKENANNEFNILNDFQGLIIKYDINSLNNQLAYTIFNTINNYLKEKNIYTVQSGDSLYSIARKFNLTVDELKKANNLTSNNLAINQKLIIPFNIQENNNNNIYYVKSGDSLYSIARKFNLTVDDIKKANNLTSNNLAINQKLVIPNI